MKMTLIILSLIKEKFFFDKGEIDRAENLNQEAEPSKKSTLHRSGNTQQPILQNSHFVLEERM